MSLTAGDKLGPYEILALIGKGGMGEVYRARDHRLARDIAVKVLLASVSRDPGRLRRFEQEARAAGRLNHPNVLAVYDVGVHDGTPYLVTELLEGESLRARLRRGPIPINKSLEVASDIARGLAAAHEKQIVHRDLKPENLFLTKDDRVKILDFGLAKLKQVGEGGPDASTETALSEAGAILGTVGYMSPEQAAAAAVDFRSDQFSFGAILYEMVTNQRAFHRATAVETLSAIIREEPRPIASLAPQTPGPVRWIVERCLAKDPADRFASTHDLARDWDGLRSHLSELTGTLRPGTLVVKRHAPVWVATALLLGLAVGARMALWWARSKPSGTPTLRYLTHSGQDSEPAASPDGRLLAFTSSRDGRPRIWLKQLAGGGEAPLTEGPDDHPRFSPDGSMILFVRTDQTRTALYRTAIVGGQPRKLVDDAHDGDWSPDGREIAFVRARSSIGVVDAGGGSPRTLVQLENRVLSFPRWSPDGRAIAIIEAPLGAYARSSLLLVPVDGKPTRVVSPPGSFLISSPAWCGPDDVVYSQADTVVAAGNNTGATARVFRQSVRSGAARQVFWTPHNSQTLDILGPGKLVFDTRSSRQSLRVISLGSKSSQPGGQWLTRGNSQDRQPVYSPDGRRLLFASNRSGNTDLWETNLRTSELRRITDDPAEDWDPAYTPDGKSILWAANRSGYFEIWIADADGNGARQLTHHRSLTGNPTATPDGWIVYATSDPSAPGFWKMRLDGSQAVRVAGPPVGLPQVSPDGQYFSHQVSIPRGGQVTLRVVRIADGAIVATFNFPVFRPGRSILGRSRWTPDGRAIAFLGQDEHGDNGIFVQDFIAGKDTARTRRPLGGFDAEMVTESFGISPGGNRMTIAAWEPLFSIMLAERVPDIAPARR